jgi:hypothetical protein
MDTEETTIWKKNRLEDKKDLANREQYIEEFQNNSDFPEIIQVERKIKKINKKRKGFSKNPILESIYDVDESPDTIREVIENFESSSKLPEKKNRQVDKKIKSTNKSASIPSKNEVEEKNTKIKNMVEIAKSLKEAISLKNRDFADNELKKEINVIKGFEKEIKKKSKNDKWCKDNTQTKFLTSLRSVVLYLKYPIIYIDYIIKKLGIVLSKALSKNKANDSDKRIVINRMKEFIYLFISLFIVYNWFFIWCFKYDDGKTGEHVITKPINISLFENSEWSILRFINKFFKYFFEFIIAPVALFDYLFTVISPVALDYVKTVNMKWVFLFIIISSSFTRIGAYFKNLFFQSLQVCFARDIPGETFGKRSASFTTYPFLHTLIAGSYIKSFWENFEIPLFFFIAIFNAIAGLIRMAFSHFNVSLAAIFVCVYLFIYSFLAIPIYSKKSISETIKLIEQFIRDSVVEKPELKTCNTTDECKNKTFLDYIFQFLQSITNVIYMYIFSISIVLVLFNSIIEYALKLENHELKMSLIMISLVMILFIGISKLQKFGDIFSNKTDT